MQKKLLFLSIVLILSSCKTTMWIYDTVPEITGMGFSPYAEQGYAFSLVMYTGDYTGVGVLRCEMYHSYEYLETDGAQRGQMAADG